MGIKSLDFFTFLPFLPKFIFLFELGDEGEGEEEEKRREEEDADFLTRNTSNNTFVLTKGDKITIMRVM